MLPESVVLRSDYRNGALRGGEVAVDDRVLVPVWFPRTLYELCVPLCLLAFSGRKRWCCLYVV